MSMLTDYPGGTRKPIRLHARREIDLGLAAMAASMPEFLAFKDEAEKGFFMTQGAIITAASQLTQFPEHARGGKEHRRAA